MAALGSQTIASSYEQLLHVDADGGGNGATLVSIKDGDNGTTFCLQIATTSALISGSGSKLYFSDAGGEYISGDGTDLTITSGADIILTPGAYVGLGTTNPAKLLHISGAADNTLLEGVQIDNTDHASGETGQAVAINMRLAQASTMRDAGRITVGKDDDWDDAAATDSHMTFKTMLSNTLTEHMRITSAGKVGIGTSSPASTLEVAGDVFVNTDGGSNTGTYKQVIDWRGAGTPSAYMLRLENSDGTNTPKIDFVLQDQSGGANEINSSIALRLGSGGSTAMYLDSSQRVGIGCEPSHHLHVEADDGESDNTWISWMQNKEATDDRNYGLRISAGSTASDTAFFVQDHDASNDFFLIRGNGKVGIGTTSPDSTSRLTVGSTTASDANGILINRGTRPTISGSQVAISCVANGDTGGSGEAMYLQGAEFHFLDDDESTKRMVIKSTGEIQQTNTSITGTTNTDYKALALTNTLTAGDWDGNDSMYGIYNTQNYSDASQLFGNMYGIVNDVRVTDQQSGGESGEIVGMITTSKMVSGSNCDVGYIYGVDSRVDMDDGTVDSDVVTSRTHCDITGGSIGNDIYGHKIHVNTTQNCAGSVRGLYVNLLGAGMDANNDLFFYCYDDQNNDVTAQITALAGVATFDSGDFSGAPDYAEYFESKDGKAIAVGTTVKLDGDKVVACGEGETPIGVVRPDGASAVQANAKTTRWHGKYQYSDYDEILLEDYKIVKWSEEITKEEYNKRGKDETGGVLGGHIEDKKIDGQAAIYWQGGETLPEGKKVGDEKTAAVADKFYRHYDFHSDRLPSGVTPPDDAEILTPNHQRKKLNPDYDLSKHESYKSRTERDEWCLIGLLGQIPITKGQPLASNWIKMKDVSDTVEMYFVK